MIDLTFACFNALALEIPMIIFIVLFVGGIVAWRVTARVRKKRGKSVGKNNCGCGSCGCCSARGSCPSANMAVNVDGSDEQMPDITVRSNVTCDFSDLIDSRGKE